MVNANETPQEQLLRLRASIDNIDAALIYMLAERFRCTQQVGELKAAIAHCEVTKDFGSRELLEDILEDQEEHIDWLETQLGLIDKVSLENYLQSQMGE